MVAERAGRREFLRSSITTVAGLAWASAPPEGVSASPRLLANASPQAGEPARAKGARIRFAAVGLNHGHIYGQVEAVLHGGGELVSFFAKEPDLASAFSKRYPQARLAGGEREILDDPSIQLVVSASIPNERAPLGIEVMRHGKDYMVDKPGITTLGQLAEVRRVQKETHRIYSILYSERLENRASVKAGELVKAGAIGEVIQTIGLGPHRMNPKTRPEWFFERERYGGILCDIGSHQFDQFLFFTGSTRAQVIASQVGNVHHPDTPGIEDFGDVMVSGNGGSGYIRVDWFTPGGLNTWGDGRLTILGTEGYIELRKYVDIAGRPGTDHLFLVDQKETRYIDCKNQELPYGEQLVNDILNRTETAMSQEHCFLAMELALQAEERAQRVGPRKVV
ncbi:MAG TPA: Gfo/Idh/MocA family oxidoreductase [Vicinamibacteria bacterium]|jgi:predicted dehydrogenase|nr:Gfo/Idh/MocA family oxidoreductase [Vicinamibacteria bacterium]